ACDHAEASRRFVCFVQPSMPNSPAAPTLCATRERAVNSRHHLKSILTAIALTMLHRKLFEENLPLIERVIVYVSRKNGLVGADAEDFASIARLALMENDFSILAHYDGRA